MAMFVVLIIYNTFPKTGGAPRLVTQPANRQAAANRVNNARPLPVEVNDEVVPERSACTISEVNLQESLGLASECKSPRRAASGTK
jgi:hypothetical protein